jgi:hypothetical protein
MAIIRCKDCKNQVKKFHADKRYKYGGYWEIGCKFFREVCIDCWGWGGEDEQFCSEAVRRGEDDN